MKNILLILFISFLSTQSESKLNIGVYGIYWDWSTYTELKIIDEKHYEYIHRGFVSDGYHCSGKYIVENGILKLLGKCKGERRYRFNGNPSRMPRLWKIGKDTLINKTEIRFPEFLEYKPNRE